MNRENCEIAGNVESAGEESVKRTSVRAEKRASIKAEKKTSVRAVRLAAVLSAVLAAACLLGGCQTAELEDREFPMLGAVEKHEDTGEISLSFVYQDLEKVSSEMTSISGPDHFAATSGDFYKAWHNYEDGQNKMVDYNHVKVLLLNEAFLRDEGQLAELLAFLDEEEAFPRNTYVCVAEYTGPLLECGEELSDDLGSYLEQTLENNESVSAKVLPTLGSLFDEQKNRSETLFLPYFVVEADMPVLDGYYCIRRGEPAGRVDSDTAYLSFLSCEKLKMFVLEEGQGNFVQLQQFKSFYQLKDEGTVRVRVSCEGEMLYGEPLENSVISKYVTDYFNRLAAENLSEGIDVSNSFKKLGGYNRDWYESWKKRANEEPSAVYEEDLNIVYDVQVVMTTQ